MTRTFDGGLTVANRTIVRNRIAELLAPLLKGNFYLRGAEEMPGFLRAVVKLAGTLESYNDGEGLQQLYSSLLGRAPAILIACGDRDPKPAGTGGFKHMSTLDVHVYFLNNHPRSLLARVEADIVSTGDAEAEPPIVGNDAADPGIDVAMQCAEELLIGQKLDTTSVGGVIKHLELKREQGLHTSNRHSLWMQVYQVGITRSIDKNRAITQKLIGIDTVVRPSGELADSPAAVTFETELREPEEP